MELTINDLAELENTLHGVAHKCIPFGLQLGVKNNRMEAIEAKHADPYDRLREVLRHRLRQLPRLTWYDIVKALQSEAVQTYDLASEIESQHMCQSSHEPQGMAQSHGTGFDSESAQVRRKRKSQVAPSHDSSSDSDTQANRKRKSQSAQSHDSSSTPQAKRKRRSQIAQSHDSSSTPHAKRKHKLRITQSYDSGSDNKPSHRKMRHKPRIAPYIKHIKALYKQSVIEKKLNAIKWPPTPSIVYINLVCVDRTTRVSKQEADECTRAMVCDGSVDVVLKKKTPIDFNDIAKDVPPSERKVILVEGAPGVGKSTLAWQFCRRWERGKIAQQYKLVLLLRLRDKGMSEAQSLADLLYHPSKAVVQAVEDELIATLGANTLIILEGFDELPSTCRTQSSVFLRLINGTLLPDATVLVTSRPWATQDLHRECRERIFQHIEILGFTGKQIEEYVTSVFMDEEKVGDDKAKENIDEVMSYIMSFPQIQSCMYIPLNSAIVVSVYQESKAGRCILPRTMTELYYALIQTLLLRYLYGHSEYGKKEWKIQSLKDDLPPDVYSKLLAISELAYSGICTDQKGSVQLIFNNLPQGFETLGLMQSVPQLYVTQGVDMSHNFLHLTVQEFLAALHISNMSPEKQLEHFQRQNNRRWRLVGGRWGEVLRFLAGITKLADISPEDLKDLLLEKPNECKISKEDYYSKTGDVLLNSQHVDWMFETQRDDLVPLVLQGKSVNFMCPSMRSLNYYSLGYCICHSHSHWVLQFVTTGREAIGEEISMFIAGVNTTDDSSARVVGLGGYTSNHPLSISTEALNMLFTELGNVLDLKTLYLKLPVECCSIHWPNLSGLQVLHLAIGDKRNWRLDTLIPQLSLKSLVISVTKDGGGLEPDDVVCIGDLFLSPNCPKHVDIADTKCSLIAEVGVDQEDNDKQVDNKSSSEEKIKSVEHIRCRLDQYSVGYVIAHSNFQWMLTVEETRGGMEVTAIEAEEVRMFIAGVNTKYDTTARIVKLGRDYHPLFMSTEVLNILFTELNIVLDLQKLYLKLPAECCSIHWPNLSKLQVLHLTISDKRNWRLDTLIPQLSLKSLVISVTSDGGGLEPDDVVCIGELFLSPNCPKHVDIADKKCSLIAEVGVDQEVNDKQVDNKSSSEEKIKSVEHIRCRLDWYSVGYIIAHSNFQWMLTVEEDRGGMEVTAIGEEEVRMLVTGIDTRCDSSARVVGLGAFQWFHSKQVPLSISTEALNMLFIKLKNVIDLQELHLNLPIQCSSIPWPSLSTLRVLDLGINDKKNWRLDTLLPDLLLESLAIKSTRVGGTVVCEDFVAITTLLSSSDCLTCFNLRNMTIDAQCMQSIAKAISDNQLQPLTTLVIEHCIFHNMASQYLAMFVTSFAALHHLSIGWCTFSAHGLLELVQAIHHSSSLQERKLEWLTCTVNSDDEATECAQISVDYPYMKDSLGMLVGSCINDRGVQAIATAVSHNTTLMTLNLSNNGISDTGSAALAQALHSNICLMELNLSNNGIGDTGLSALGQAFFHMSHLNKLNLSNNNISDTALHALHHVWMFNGMGLELNLSNNNISDTGSATLAWGLIGSVTKLNLSGNSAISAVGTHKLVSTLAEIDRPFRHRLIIPRTCEKYATQCPLYSKVKNCITFE